MHVVYTCMYIYICIYIYVYIYTVYVYINIDKSDVFTKMRNRQYALRLIVGTPINQPASLNDGMLCDFLFVIGAGTPVNQHLEPL